MHQVRGSWVLHAARPAPAETRQYRRGGPIVPRDGSTTPRCLPASPQSSHRQTMSLLRIIGVALLLWRGDTLRAPAAPPMRMSLVGSTYRVNLDFGRETGTWMPPRWAVNAGRTEYTLDLTF